MVNNTDFLEMQDGVEVFVRKWANVKNPQGILLIAHGMAEHSERYDTFARHCNELGLIVIANDHRGHGQTGEKTGLLGYFAPQDGFERVVDDLYEITLSIQAKYSDLPTFLMGHSMGSFLVRRYIQKYGDSVNGAIIMGSSAKPGPELQIGKLIARIQMRKKPTSPSNILDKMAFGNYNKTIKNSKTEFDWLSRDETEVQKYINDPHCGFVCSSGFFYDLFTGLEKIHKPQEVANIPKNLPILVISGAADPVGKNGRGVRKIVQQLQKNGVKNIKTILYSDARHEILHEINKTEVMEDLSLWLQERLDELS